MLPHLITLLLICFSQIGFTQIISQFDWDGAPVTSATIGPDAISVSASAQSYAGGVGGTNGLNANPPGFVKLDLNFVIPGGPLFDVSGIDVSIDHQREESTANFFDRGLSLIITAGGNFSVSYRVDNGMGGFSTVNSGAAYSIPVDDTFRNYRFYYLASSGIGVLSVDGVVVWTNDGPDGRNMYWTGAGDITIGKLMDGNGSNKTILDNLIIANIFDSPLPVNLLKFDIEQLNNIVRLNWITASELNNDKFRLEKSKNGKDWFNIGEINGAGNSSQKIEYTFADFEPYFGQSFYRIIQVDFDGKETTYAPRSIYNQQLNLFLHPNPANNFIHLEGLSAKEVKIQIYTVDGIKVYEDYPNNGLIDIGEFSSGTYYLTVNQQSIPFVISR